MSEHGLMVYFTSADFTSKTVGKNVFLSWFSPLPTLKRTEEQ